jgi:hypothetical protein
MENYTLSYDGSQLLMALIENKTTPSIFST